MDRITKLSTLAAILALVGAAWVWYHDLRPARVMNGFPWIVLALPVQMQEGYSISSVFTVNTKTVYWLNIECEKSIPSNLLYRALSQELVVEFKIMSNAVIVASGDAGTNARTSDYSIRRLAEFVGHPGVQYDLNLRVSRSSPALAPANPTLKVSVNPAALKNVLVAVSISGYKMLGLILFGLLGFLPLFIHFVSRFVKS